MKQSYANQFVPRSRMFLLLVTITTIQVHLDYGISRLSS